MPCANSPSFSGDIVQKTLDAVSMMAVSAIQERRQSNGRAKDSEATLESLPEPREPETILALLDQFM